MAKIVPLHKAVAGTVDKTLSRSRLAQQAGSLVRRGTISRSGNHVRVDFATAAESETFANLLEKLAGASR